MLNQVGVPWTFEQGTQLCGSPWQVSAAAIRAHANAHGYDFPFEDYQISRNLQTMVTDYVRTHPLPWMKGAQALVEALVERGVPMAVVSASPRELLDAGISRMPAGAFDVIIDGFAVTRGKPDPEGYLKAAHELGVDPTRCIVIEDSQSGLRAGIASGASVIGLPGMHPVEPDPRVVALDSLEDITIDDLPTIWQTSQEARKK